MRSVGFNTKKMDLKIKKNLKKGFDIKGIHLALMNEYLEILKQMKPYEIRALELSDQIDYMREKYPIVKKEK